MVLEVSLRRLLEHRWQLCLVAAEQGITPGGNPATRGVGYRQTARIARSTRNSGKHFRWSQARLMRCLGYAMTIAEGPIAKSANQNSIAGVLSSRVWSHLSTRKALCSSKNKSALVNVGP